MYERWKMPPCAIQPKCINHSVNFRTSGQIVDLEDEDGNDDLGTDFIPYICMSCGFTAMYVEDVDDIKDLPKTNGWKKVQ